MFSFPPRCRTIIQHLIVTLLSGALLLAPIPTDVAQAAACTNGVGGITLVDVSNPDQPNNAFPDALNLHFIITPDGSVQVGGVVYRDFLIDTFNLAQDDLPTVLAAIPHTAVATCADRDGDALGLTAIAVDVASGQPTGKRQHLPIRLGLATTGGQAISASGPYSMLVSLQIGETTLTAVVEVFVELRDPQRATTPEERVEATAAAVARPASKHKAKAKPDEKRRGKGHKAGKGKPGTRR
jgi:hypothetical protein